MMKMLRYLTTILVVALLALACKDEVKRDKTAARHISINMLISCGKVSSNTVYTKTLATSTAVATNKGRQTFYLKKPGI